MKQEITSLEEDVEKVEPSYVSGGDVTCWQLWQKIVSHSPNQVNAKHQVALPLLGRYIPQSTENRCSNKILHRNAQSSTMHTSPTGGNNTMCVC